MRARRAQAIEEVNALNVAIAALEHAHASQLALGRAAAIPGGTIVPQEFTGLTYADAVEVALNRANRQPLSTNLLLRRLEAGGRPVQGKRPYKTLYRTLEKDKRFKQVQGAWALAEWYEELDEDEPCGNEDSEGEQAEGLVHASHVDAI